MQDPQLFFDTKPVKSFTLGKYKVIPNELCLMVDNKKQSIEPKCMELLLLLIQSNGEVVTRDKIMKEVWAGRYVSDYALNNVVSSLRKYLRDDENQTNPIDTIKKRGYQLNTKIENIVYLSHRDATQVTIKDTAEEISTANDSLLKQASHYKSTLIITFLIICLLAAILYINKVNDSIDKSNNVNSLAVLPFDVTGEAENIDFFAQGLSEELIHQLSAVPNYNVVSKYSSFTFKDSDKSLQDISQMLEVNYLIQGSVRQYEEVFKVTIQLIDASKDITLWSQSFSASKDKMLSIQHDITEQVVLSLDGDLGQYQANKRATKTQSTEAYLHLMRGRKLNQVRTTESLLEARDQFLMATLIDPDYAVAYADLAVSYLLMGQSKLLSQEEASSQASKAIEQALAIDDSLHEAHAAKGVLAHSENRINDAEQAFKDALSFNKDSYLAMLNYASLLLGQSRNKESLALYEKALKLGPLSGAANWGVASQSLAVGNFDRAIMHYELCTRRLPNDYNCKFGYAYGLRIVDKHEQADEVFAQLNEAVLKDNYYYLMAKSWQSLWSQNIELASQINDTIIEKFGLNNDALQMILFAKLYSGEIEQWYARVFTLYNEESLGLSAQISVAHAAYFTNQCDIATDILDNISGSHPSTFEDVDLLANGVSLYAIQAHCYSKLGNDTKAQEATKKLDARLTQLPVNTLVVPSILYASAQRYYLQGNIAKYNLAMAQLKLSKWGLMWLIAKDPLFAHDASVMNTMAYGYN